MRQQADIYTTVAIGGDLIEVQQSLYRLTVSLNDNFRSYHPQDQIQPLADFCRNVVMVVT
jgi:hypothetical protein